MSLTVVRREDLLPVTSPEGPGELAGVEQAGYYLGDVADAGIRTIGWPEHQK